MRIENGEIIAEEWGHAPRTTNNRMEWQALVAAYRQMSRDVTATIYTDSNNCYRTIAEWAPRWEMDGWVRANGQEIKNLDLVREVWDLARERPEVELRWTARASCRWNAYVDALANLHEDGGR